MRKVSVISIGDCAQDPALFLAGLVVNAFLARQQVVISSPLNLAP